MSAALMNQKKQAQRLLKIQIDRCKKIFRVNTVAAFVRVKLIRHADGRKLLEVTKNRTTAHADQLRQIFRRIAVIRLERCQYLNYSADSA